MSDSLGTLQFKDSDKADRAVIVLLCIYGVSDHGVYGDIYNHNFKENIQFYGIGDMVLKIDQICSLLNTPQATTERQLAGKRERKTYKRDYGAF